jgi:hypothetical protein
VIRDTDDDTEVCYVGPWTRGAMFGEEFPVRNSAYRKSKGGSEGGFDGHGHPIGDRVASQFLQSLWS